MKNIFNIGEFRCCLVSDTEFALDGGAMFGVIPKALWSKALPPDEANRIPMQSFCLFIETASEKILIETGMGEKWSEKSASIYGIKRRKSFAETLFEQTGSRVEDISIVVNTHLHFDHCGGNTIKTAAGEIAAQFPNARYLMSENEFRHAENPTERDRASYLPENWTALKQSGQIELKPAEYEVVSGITMRETRGHNATMQTLTIESNGETLFHPSDLIPTTHHLGAAWIMGYDLFPLETLANKKKAIAEALEKNAVCWFYHDPHKPLCRLKESEGKISAEEI